MTWPPIEALVPHRGEALWLDRVLSHGDGQTRCLARIAPGHPLVDDGRLPGLAAFELIAQAAAAHATLSAGHAQEPEPGVVGSVSGVEVTTAWLEPSARLEVVVTQLAGGDGATAGFTGEVWADGVRVGTGRVTVARGQDGSRRSA